MKKRVVEYSLVFLMLVSLVFAAHVVKNSDGDTAYSFMEDVSYLYNISINNTDTTSGQNITFVYIKVNSTCIFAVGTNATEVAETSSFVNSTVSGQTFLNWTNSTEGLVTNGSVNNYFLFNLTCSTPRMFNISIETANATAVYQSNITLTINNSNVTIDFVAPTNLSGSNVSSSAIEYNVSVTDDGIIDTIIVFLLNSTFDAVNDSGYSTSGVSSLNGSFAGHGDGIYYLNATANDTLDHMNTTSLINLTYDTTNPTITGFTCTPTTVSVGGRVTCSCSATDNLDTAPTTNFNATPSTVTAGTSTQTCTATDHAGNTASSTVTLTITSGSGSYNPAANGGWTNTYIINDNDFQAGYTREIRSNQRLKVRITSEDHYVGLKAIENGKARVEITSDPQEALIGVGEEKKFEVTGDNVYDLSVIVNSIGTDKVDLTIKPISESMTAEQQQESNSAKAGSIIGDDSEEIQQPTGEKTSSLKWILIVIIVLVVLALVYLLVSKKGKKKR